MFEVSGRSKWGCISGRLSNPASFQTRPDFVHAQEMSQVLRVGVSGHFRTRNTWEVPGSSCTAKTFLRLGISLYMGATLGSNSADSPAGAAQPDIEFSVPIRVQRRYTETQSEMHLAAGKNKC